jgi:uncharacterized protein YlxW (UPF0749 family)
MVSIADGIKVQKELEKLVKAVNELANKVARLESRVSAVEKSQDHPKSS